MSRDGLIGGAPARLDGLRLSWRGREFDLQREIVRHRDDDGAITFSAGGERARYRRGEPEPSLPTEDEPWTWEDGDFGLFVFHVATRTGPLKYRDDEAPAGEVRGHRGLEAGDEGLTRRLPGMRPQAVRWQDLGEIRAKFELAGIYADPVLLLLDAGDDLVVVPVGSTRDVTFVEAVLAPRLERLPGWDGAALDAALRFADGSVRADAAERAVWKRPAG